MSKKAFIGRKLREARMYRGKTIDVLAKETNINKKDFYLLHLLLTYNQHFHLFLLY